LQSVIDNYKGNDEILPTAKQKLDRLSPGGRRKQGGQQKPVTDTTGNAKQDTTKDN
jgi:hypothetical protein